MYYWNAYIIENGKIAKNLSQYLMIPIFIEDRLDETLDTGEIVLDAVPTSTMRTPLPPKTKIRLKMYTTQERLDTPKTWDMVVEHDDVEEYPGAPQYCCHHVNLIEASVIAQGMHVDNIALTYELQDVTLNYKTVTEFNDGIKVTIPPPNGHTAPVRQSDLTVAPSTPIVGSTTTSVTYFRNSYRMIWDESSLTSIRGLKAKINGGKAEEISFTVPKLWYQGCYTSGTWSNLFEMNTKTTVTCLKRKGNIELSRKTVQTKYSGSTVFSDWVSEVHYLLDNLAGVRTKKDINKITVERTIFGSDWENTIEFEGYFTLTPTMWINLPIANASQNYADKTINFTTEQLSLEELEIGVNLTYEITCSPVINYPENTLKYYQKECSKTWKKTMGKIDEGSVEIVTTKQEKITDADVFHVSTQFVCTNAYTTHDGGYLLKHGAKYCCYDLLKKALLTVDTKIINPQIMGIDGDLKHSIILDSDDIELNNKLKSTQMFESIFEEKNLWEIMMQIGHYIHAIPYLEFANDETDRYILKFKQLGMSKVKEDKCVKISVFNSQNISDYFTQYDSYVNNLFSPQNVVEEWLVPKTSDSTYLVSNNTAELHTCFPISEIIEFEITYDGSVGGTKGTKSALGYIFERSIYQLWSDNDPQMQSPVKGNSLYYSWGDNKILGLNYVALQINPGTNRLALQEICRILFGAGTGFLPESLQYNALQFRIKYRTQDSLRLSQVRPDLKNFLKNSNLESYPHHEQYYGQQDKIVDSERFSANLWGRLIRMGNEIYQRQEYSTHQNEKESGDLVKINGENYYVTAIDSEYYGDIILQKVTYSKNFNQLSNIVTIPSEPRFYEVSERSKIRREVRLIDFLELSTTPPEKVGVPRFLNPSTWKTFVKGFLFDKNRVLPNFAYTKFMADKFRNSSTLFPSSDIVTTSSMTSPVEFKEYSDCIVPIMHFPLRNGILFEWDMADNFKVGDFVKKVEPKNSEDKSYSTLQSVRYVDYMGRADLFSFKLFNKADWSFTQSQSLPKAVIVPTDSQSNVMCPTGKAIGLDKDNREALSFNYQINLLYGTKSGDNFITFPNLFGAKESELKMCFLNKKQSMFDDFAVINEHTLIADNVMFDVKTNHTEAIEVNISSAVDLAEVKSIVLYQEAEGGKASYIVKNVDELPNERKLDSWWIYPAFNSED